MNFIRFPFSIILAAVTLTSGAQSVDISSNPSKAHILTEGTSTHKTTPTRTKFIDNGKIYVFKEGHLPAVILQDSPREVNLDLMPVIDILSGQKTPKVEFSKLVLNIPEDKVISAIGTTNRTLQNNGYVRRSLESNINGWKEKMTAELSKRGINIPVSEVDLFGGRSQKESPAFLVGAEVTDLWISTTAGRSYAVMQVKWSLFDQKRRKVVYEKVSYGYGTGPENGREHLDQCAITAATHLTCEEELLNALMGLAAEGEEAGNEFKSIHIPEIKALDIPVGSNLIKRSIESTVTVVTEKGFGSGVIISEDGKILTNEHVISGAASIEVVFSSGLRLDAEFVRSDRYFDVALIQITSGKGYKAMPLVIKDAPGYEVGDDVMAIGTPISLDLGQTVSRGIVSGNRKHEERLFIQTDVSVNEGNSGGPLINKDGKVVGLVTLKIAGGGSEGLAFAIPANQVFEMLNITYSE